MCLATVECNSFAVVCELDIRTIIPRAVKLRWLESAYSCPHLGVFFVILTSKLVHSDQTDRTSTLIEAISLADASLPEGKRKK